MARCDARAGGHCSRTACAGSSSTLHQEFIAALRPVTSPLPTGYLGVTSTKGDGHPEADWTTWRGPVSSARTRTRPGGIHPAWLVAAVTLVCLLVASVFRSSAGVLLQPLEQEFGWSRATTSGAASLNLVVYGLAAPFAAAVMELWGPRRTVSVSLLVVGLAAVASTAMTRPGSCGCCGGW